jgi:hypothetical protein
MDLEAALEACDAADAARELSYKKLLIKAQCRDLPCRGGTDAYARRVKKDTPRSERSAHNKSTSFANT